jgi:hypothetical protein
LDRFASLRFYLNLQGAADWFDNHRFVTLSGWRWLADFDQSCTGSSLPFQTELGLLKSFHFDGKE